MKIDADLTKSTVWATGLALATIALFVACSPKAKPQAQTESSGRAQPESSAASAPAEPAMRTEESSTAAQPPAGEAATTAATKPATATPPAAGSAATKGSERRVPEDHVKNKHGKMHMLGYKNPEGICTVCHGADLRGSEGRPSCYSCHGKKWKS